MLFKIAALFLVAMAVLALFGRLRFPGALKRPLPRAPKAPASIEKALSLPIQVEKKSAIA